MLSRSRTATCLWILAIALLALRMGGEHLHLCLDGGEAAAAVHAFDLTEHSEAMTSHNDRNLDLSGVALSKKKGDASEILAPLLGVMVLLFLVPSSRSLLPRPRAIPVPMTRWAYFTPPLRGPPL
jgi:hypothetical protein